LEKSKIGFDWDGTLTKYPPIIGFLSSRFSSSTTPKFIYKPWWSFVLSLPIFLNYKRLEILKQNRKEFKYFIISGRLNGFNLIRKFLKRAGYLELFEGIFTNSSSYDLTTALFKEKMCKKLGIELFFDDSPYIVSYLRNKRILAVRV